MADQPRLTAAAALFSPNRLTLVREARGMQKGQLAAAVGVSPQAVGQYEAGRTKPSAPTVARLAMVLGVPVESLADDGRTATDAPPAYFRTRRGVPLRELRKAKAQATFAHDLVNALEAYVRLPEVNLPGVSGSGPFTDTQVDEAASQARKALGIEGGPVGSLVRRIERAGVPVVRLPVDEERIDAFTVPFPDRPVIVLSSHTHAHDRYRWNAAHELGHLVLHGTVHCEPGSRHEKEAHAFAAAFLLPADEVRFRLPRRTDWPALLEMKRDWGVAVAALVQRSFQLGLISDHQRTNMFKAMSANGWRKDEPVWLGQVELPTLVSTAMQTAVANAGVTAADIARAARLSMNDVDTILGGVTDHRPEILPAVPEDAERLGDPTLFDGQADEA